MKTHKKIYFSASIRGEKADPKIGMKNIKYLQSLGHRVLSEHVGSSSREEMNTIIKKNTGTAPSELSEPKMSQYIREIDTNWVDEADDLVVVVTGASLGVGMEIERALLKPERGLNHTPIHCFVQAEYLENLSAMVKGITETQFTLYSYQNFEDIKEALKKI
jgi:hypothetical protein